jgi:hypothetical protein
MSISKLLKLEESARAALAHKEEGALETIVQHYVHHRDTPLGLEGTPNKEQRRRLYSQNNTGRVLCMSAPEELLAIRFSQDTVSTMSLDSNGRPFRFYDSIKTQGWQAGQAITCVRMPDEMLTCLNNRRLLAIQNLLSEDPSFFQQCPVEIRVVSYQHTSRSTQDHVRHLYGQSVRKGSTPNTPLQATMGLMTDPTLSSPLTHPLTASGSSPQARLQNTSPLMPLPVTPTYGDMIRLRMSLGNGDCLANPFGFYNKPQENHRSELRCASFEDTVRVDET